MSARRMGPKQQKDPKLPQSPQQGYGEPLAGSHKVKQANHTRDKQKSSHDM
ncbi:small acid-soluble spore protein P [Halobacillus sp. BBL2006]|uniref:small acid-soluble spore protein P n=1 Tax=Halobacillus sp. BBL2006 TaxID=1543706 RepID=UPI00054309D1|nr:small acid-soluble spore protein P [Halobacillus sp. BBL2006]KHE71566.1 spore protein [Halobacillus sp. BBL2006]